MSASLVVGLGNRDPATSGLGATASHGTLLPCHGFTAVLPIGVLRRVWHPCPGWARLLDVDSEESYQPMVRWLEDSYFLGQCLLALSSGLLGLTPSLGAPLFPTVPGDIADWSRPADAWRGLLECGLALRRQMVAHASGPLSIGVLRPLSIGVLRRVRWAGAQRRRGLHFILGLRVSTGFSSRSRSFFGSFF